MSDLSYTKSEGMFSLLPNTDEAVGVINEIMVQNHNSNKFFPHEFPSVKQQIHASGYTLSKEKTTRTPINELLAELIEG